MTRTLASCWTLGLFAMAVAQNPQPQLTGITPQSLVAGGGARNLGAFGSGFVPSSQVTWDGVPLQSTYRGSMLLEAEVPAQLTAVPGTVSVAVVTPPPGGGASVVVTLTITACAQGGGGYVLAGPAVGSRFGQELDVVGDVDGDSGQDLMIRSNQGRSLHSGATGALIPTFGLDLAGWCGDVNADGRADVVTSLFGSVLEVFSGADLGGVPLLSVTVVGPVRDIRSVGDLTGDGRDDFGVAGDNRLTVVSGIDGTILRVLQGMPGDALATSFDRTGDVNGDGLGDLIVGSPGAQPDGRVDVYESATWSIVSTFQQGFGLGAWTRGADDFDADGTPDFLFSKQGELALVSGATGVTLATPDAQVGVSMGDFDDDGDADLLFGDPATNLVWLLGGNANMATLSRTFPCFTQGDAYGARVAAGDVNGDGFTDIAIAATQPGITAPVGAGYVSVIFGPLATSESVGSGCSSVGPPPALGVALPVLGEAAAVSVTGAPPGTLGLLAFSPGGPMAPISLGGSCSLFVDPAAYLGLPFAPDAGGVWTLSITLPMRANLAGLRFRAQAALSPVVGVPGVALTNGVSLRLGW